MTLGHVNTTYQIQHCHA